MIELDQRYTQSNLEFVLFQNHTNKPQPSLCTSTKELINLSKGPLVISITQWLTIGKLAI